MHRLFRRQWRDGHLHRPSHRRHQGRRYACAGGRRHRCRLDAQSRARGMREQGQGAVPRGRGSRALCGTGRERPIEAATLRLAAMKTVTLFRHAKSDWKDSAIIDDFDRPLSERGVKAAPKMGKVIRAHGLMPDIILCSPSVRTRQTLQLAAPNAFETLPEIRFDPKLYHPDVEALLHFLRALPETVAHVMIVGHNPELQELAVTLAAKDD